MGARWELSGSSWELNGRSWEIVGGGAVAHIIMITHIIMKTPSHTRPWESAT